uniref:4-(cytidine 5'-diphospho)-2-C-methyl-D-erythritol kinase n=1 Tax=Ningiella ruwaisensis TaxID=2364274 RepID=UPI001F4F23FF|nr:4-(cytidine 5'-diphospho)-2-C-methyl-D-erythritol kinase [Ningiella ruwaisensis]
MINFDAPFYVLSPAKLNLFLHICGRLENGYHHLQTLFQLLDYGDTIGFKLIEAPKIHLLNPIAGVNNADNLLLKAANALLPYKNSPFGIELSIDKRLPMGGGIGGGSSNAATVLLALNQAWECRLSIDELAEIGLKLGADVPVFVRGRTAFASGVGEALTPVELSTRTYLVATPKTHISTQAIFNHPDLPRNTPEIAFSDYSFEQTRNDCEILVSKMDSKVANLLQWLLNYAPSRMTGTGASVFAIFDNEDDAKQILKLLPDGISGFIAKGVNYSSAHKSLDL